MTASPSERICVVIGRTRHKMVQAEIQEAARHGARLIELRLDFLAKAPDFKRLLADKPCPLVATVRRPADGGRWTGTEEARRMLLRQAIVAGFDWVDLETDVADDIRRFGRRQAHRQLPQHARGARRPGEDPRAHVPAGRRRGQDRRPRPAAGRQPARPAPGARSRPSRPSPSAWATSACPAASSAPSTAAPFTYAAFNKERGIAPGLPSFDELKQRLSLRRASTPTRRSTASSAIRWRTASAR